MAVSAACGQDSHESRDRPTPTGPPVDYPALRRLFRGATVTVRRLEPTDYDAVILLATQLNATERNLRFFERYPTFIGEWAHSLTVPTDGMVALGAFESGELVGVANYVESAGPGIAEIAVVVAHDQHRRGIGTVLLQELGQIATEAGLRHLVADVLAENQEMLDVIRAAGWPVIEHPDGQLIRLTLHLAGTSAITNE